MNELVINNRIAAFNVSRSFSNMVDNRTSFLVPGYFFADAFKNGFWDGREHLVKKSKDHQGWMECPVGLVDEILKVARVEGVELAVTDLRRPPSHRIETTWNPRFNLRPYQEECVAEALLDRGLVTGKGLLNIPTRGGKTVIAAAIIHRLGLRTVFFVQSEMLKRQTVALFENALGVKVGTIGSGVWDPGPITVASLQTLIRHIGKTDECAEFLGSADVAFFDEVHHSQGDKFRDVFFATDAFYKFGLSATLFFNKKKETPKGTIWIRGTCGPILYKIEPSDLIRMGYLVPPRITMTQIVGPPIMTDYYPDARSLGIVRCAPRNQAIVDRAVRCRDEGMLSVVIVKEIEHCSVLLQMMEDRGLRVGVIVGETPSAERIKVVKKYEERKLDVLLGTVFGEAVDIPSIEAVIVAEGGKSEIATTQRFRNLTPAPGKTRAELFDFADLHHPVLAGHSRARLKVYRGHTGFDVVLDEEVIGG